MTAEEVKELPEDSEDAIPAEETRETESAGRKTWRWRRRRGGKDRQQSSGWQVGRGRRRGGQWL